MSRLFFALAALLVLAGCARLGGEAFQASHSGAVPLDAPVGQTFRPATSGIRGIDLLTATYGQEQDPSGTLRATLRDAQSGTALAVVSVGGDRIGDNRWVPVRFDPPVPAPEVASITVTWDGDTPVALRANVPPADFDPVEQDANDPYPGGELLRDGVPAAGDLAFRVLGTGGPRETAAQLVGMVQSAGGRLLRDELGFALSWLALLAGAVTLAVIGFRQRRTHPMAPRTPPGG
ncbi:MAG: hypothetical protein ACRD0K_24105 [Egibacteraceae bacterium]